LTEDRSKLPHAGLDTRPSAWTLPALLVAAAVVRLLGHFHDGLWFDEIWTIRAVLRHPLGEILTTFASDNNHPLFSLLAWFSIQGFGESAFAVRLPAMLFGVAGVAALWALCRLLTSWRETLLATSLLAFSCHHVAFSQEARGYTALLFFGLASTYWFLRAQAGDGKRAWLWHGVLLGLGTYAHASLVLLALAHFVIYLVALFSPKARARAGVMDSKSPIIGLVIAGTVSLLLYSPILGQMLGFMTSDATVVRMPGVAGADLALRLLNPLQPIATAAQSFGMGLIPGLILIATVVPVLIVGAVSYLRSDWRVPTLVLVPGIAMPLLTTALGRQLMPRFLFFLGGFGLLLFVRGTLSICSVVGARARIGTRARVTNRLQLGAGVLLVLGSLGLLNHVYALPKQDFEGAMAYVQSLRKPGDTVLAAGLTRLAFDYYEAGYTNVLSAAEVERALESPGAVYALYTLPGALQGMNPQLAEALIEHGDEIHRFRGFVLQGDVVLLRLR
jgi:hypothetical protein